MHPPGRGMRRRLQRTGLAQENFLHQPDAADPGNAIEREVPFHGFSGRRLYLAGLLYQPSEIMGLERHTAHWLDGRILAECVIAVQTFVVDEVIAELTALAAEAGFAASWGAAVGAFSHGC